MARLHSLPGITALSCLLLASASSGQLINYEVRLPTGNGPIERWVYGNCRECTLEQFEAAVVPAGYSKGNPKYLLVSSGASDFPKAPPGVPPALDVIPEIPGDDFVLIAKVLGADILGATPDGIVFSRADVRRDTLFQFGAGTVIHQATDPDGNVYTLFVFDIELSQTFHFEQEGGLAGFPLPPGWTYSSTTLTSPKLLLAQGVADVLAVTDASGSLATWQRERVMVPVAGRRLAIRNRRPHNPSRASLIVRAVDGAITVPPPGSPGDPRCGAGNGGVVALGSTSTAKKFVDALPCEHWHLLGTEAKPRGYRYVDRRRDDGPCRRVTLRPGLLAARCTGKATAPLAYDLAPGDTESPVVVMLGVGNATYCTRFGGEVKKNGSDGRRVVAIDAPAPATCPD